jgi:hypothetical protein
VGALTKIRAAQPANWPVSVGDQMGSDPTVVVRTVSGIPQLRRRTAPDRTSARPWLNVRRVEPSSSPWSGLTSQIVSASQFGAATSSRSTATRSEKLSPVLRRVFSAIGRSR